MEEKTKEYKKEINIDCSIIDYLKDTLKAGDLVFLKNEGAKLYRVLAPADANGTIQLHLVDGSPVDVYNVHVSCIKIMMMTSDFVKPVKVVFD